jgi:hypothetical protein
MASNIWKALDKDISVAQAKVQRAGSHTLGLIGTTPDTPPRRSIAVGSDFLGKLVNGNPVLWAIIRTIREFVSQCDWAIIPNTKDLKAELDRWRDLAMSGVNPYGLSVEFETELLDAELQKLIRNELENVTTGTDDFSRHMAIAHVVTLFDLMSKYVDQRCAKHVAEVSALFKHPNNDSELSWRSLMERIVSDRLIYDAGVIVKGRAKGHEGVVELYDLPGQEVRRWINADRSTPQPPDPAYTWVHQGYKVQDGTFTNPDLIYIMGNPQQDGFGISPVEVARFNAIAQMDGERFNWDLITQYSVPPVVFFMPGSSPEERKQLETQFNNRGVSSMFKAMFVGGGGLDDFKPTQLKTVLPADMQLNQWDTHHTGILCMVHGLGPQDIGLVADYHRTTAETQAALSKVKAVRSECTLLEAYLNGELVWKEFYKDVSFKFLGLESEMEPQVQADMDHKDIDSGILNRNFRRARLGEPPIPGGDVYTVNTGMGLVPMDKLSEYTREQTNPDRPDNPPVDETQGGAQPGDVDSEGNPMTYADNLLGEDQNPTYASIGNPLAKPKGQEEQKFDSAEDIAKAREMWKRRQVEIERELEAGNVTAALNKADILRYNLRKASGVDASPGAAFLQAQLQWAAKVVETVYNELDDTSKELLEP